MDGENSRGGGDAMWVCRCELRQRRMEKRLTQTDLAKLLCDNGLQVGRSQVSNWEKGKNTPLADTAGVIAVVLGVRFEQIWIVEWAEKKHP